MTIELILASSSPRRRELLAGLGLDFHAEPAGIDETPAPGEAADDYTRRMAREKAITVGRQRPDAWILGSDTTVAVDGKIFGKPADAAEARRMLETLSGRWHEVMSAVTLAGNEAEDTLLNVTRVRFADLPADWIESYIAGGEPVDKAGAYGIQGQAALWIPELEGSYTGVMGLPLFETAQLLRQAQLL